MVSEMEKAMNEFGETLHMLSMRHEALIKMATFCPEKLVSDGKFNLAEYYRYVNKMLTQFVPISEDIITSPSFMERCQLAKRWNGGSPEMPIVVDELRLHELVLSPSGHWPTEEETAAMNELPRTGLFKEHWDSVLAAKAKMNTAE